MYSSSTFPYLALTAVVTVGMQLFFFAIAATFRFDKVTDLAGSMNFIVLALLVFCLNQTYFVRQIVATILVCVWALRLGTFLLYRVLKRGKDSRFDEIRNNFLSFLGFWIFQILWVWIVSLPLTFLNGFSTNSSIGTQDIIGWVFWGIGFSFEAAADISKQRFFENPQNKGQFIRSGVWAVSRHPNYFGDILLWLGVFLTASSAFEANSRWAYFSVASPVFTLLLLMFLSGIPLGEKKYDEMFANSKAYWDWKEQTSVLLPFPPSWYRRLPSLVKTILFFEFPFYTHRQLANSSSAADPLVSG